VRPDLTAGLLRGEGGIAEAVVEVRVSDRDHVRQLRDRPDGAQEFAAFSFAATSVDHQAAVVTKDEPGVQVKRFVSPDEDAVTDFAPAVPGCAPATHRHTGSAAGLVCLVVGWCLVRTPLLGQDLGRPR
jgi:hypothetical protein